MSDSLQLATISANGPCHDGLSRCNTHMSANNKSCRFALQNGMIKKCKWLPPIVNDTQAQHEIPPVLLRRQHHWLSLISALQHLPCVLCRIAWPLRTLSQPGGSAQEPARLLGFNHHVVVLHNDVHCQLLPSCEHLLGFFG